MFLTRYQDFLERFPLNIPLCVDLDGTLIQEDVTFLSVKYFLKKRSRFFWKLFLWSLQGRAVCKQKLARDTQLSVEELTVNKALLDLLREEKEKGRFLVLATAADQRQAETVENHLVLFDQIVASDGQINCRAQFKAERLMSKFSETGFLYAGNSVDDLCVWAVAQGALCVNVPQRVLRKVPGLKIPYCIVP